MLPARIDYVRKALPVALRILKIDRQVEDVDDELVISSLDGVYLVAGDSAWELYVEVHYPATRDVPPDMDFFLVQTVNGSDDQAITEFLSLWVRQTLEQSLWSEMLTPEDF